MVASRFAFDAASLGAFAHRSWYSFKYRYCTIGFLFRTGIQMGMRGTVPGPSSRIRFQHSIGTEYQSTYVTRVGIGATGVM